jgi:hydrogenase maturation protease
VRTLVIAYGNPLAGDDGIGAAVAGHFRARPGLAVEIVHQLTPELAADVALVDRVIFVDATTADDEVRVCSFESRGDDTAMSHTLSPAAVLHLAGVVYGRVPPAFLVTAPAYRFGIGEGLSAGARRHVRKAVEEIEALVSVEAPPPTTAQVHHAKSHRAASTLARSDAATSNPETARKPGR